MTATYLQKTIKNMHTSGMYQKLVFYLESCNSGSMFEGLSSDLNVYTTTAANPTEPSYGVFCPPYDKVNGKSLATCLGDLYSVNWMNDTDMKGVGHSIHDQFLAVQNKTKKKSHVMQYGDTTISQEDLAGYQAEEGYDAPMRAGPDADSNADDVVLDGGAVDSRDIPLVLAFYRYLRAGEHSGDHQYGSQDKTRFAQQLIRLIKERKEADELMGKLLGTLSAVAESVAATATAANNKDAAAVGACKEQALQFVQDKCSLSSWTGYHGRYSAAIAEYCRTNSLTQISRAVDGVCP